MQISRWVRVGSGLVLRPQFRRQAERFLTALKDCRRAQQEVLQQLLRLNASSCFSRDHRLDQVRSAADLRARVPITGYDYYRTYIDRLKLGEHGALLGPDNKLLMFSLSSGTTSESKYIPITTQFLRDYRRGWQAWGILTFDQHPQVYNLDIVQLTSDFERYHTPAGIPCGNISGLVVQMQNPIVRAMYCVPPIVSKINDPTAKYYAALRTSLADPYVGMATTANPSTLIHLAKVANAEKESLIRDIADGTLAPQFDIAPEIRRRLKSFTRRDRNRARQLERIIDRTGHLYPRDYWPNLRVLAIWCGGSAAAYLPSARRFYGEVPVRDHGLHASEGRMTIPVSDGSSAGILEVCTHFFEFIPVSEYGTDNPTLLEAHELQEGGEYYILLTTSSGLYRYDICDVVQCVGFHGTTPVLEFLHKGAHIANVTGEKLSESQVVVAVRECVERLRVELEHYTVSPIFGEPPRYQMFAEHADVGSDRIARRLEADVDASLMRLNCEYEEKRTTGRLGPLQLVTLPEGTWKSFIRQRQSKLGGSIEQYKHPCLIPDINFAGDFLKRHAGLDSEAAQRNSAKVHVRAG